MGFIEFGWEVTKLAINLSLWASEFVIKAVEKMFSAIREHMARKAQDKIEMERKMERGRRNAERAEKDNTADLESNLNEVRALNNPPKSLSISPGPEVQSPKVHLDPPQFPDKAHINGLSRAPEPTKYINI